MKKYLFVAEKNSEMQAVKEAYSKYKTEFISKYGFELDFVALSGHVYKTWEPKDYTDLGWDDSDWAGLLDHTLPMVPNPWKIKPIDTKTAKDARSRLDEKFADNHYDGLVSGCDPDQEGTGIFELCRDYRGWHHYPTYRFGSASMAESDMHYALMNMYPYEDPKNLNEVKSFHFRQYWDWLIGMNYTIAYSAVLGTTIKVGSVKGPTMLLIAKNCEDIDSFVKHTDYAIEAHYEAGFKGTMVDDDKKEIRYPDAAKARVAASFLAKSATVLEYTKTRTVTKAPKLYSLADLQADAGKKFYYSPDQTLEIAQALYEMKILSYPRTDGNYITTATAETFIPRIAAIMGNPELDPFIKRITRADIAKAQADKNMVDDKKVAKQNHDALLPTEKKADWDALTPEQRNIFTLVCKRFLSHFLGVLEEDKTTLLTVCSGTKFYSTGKRMLKAGFSEIYAYNPEDTFIPEHKKDDIILIENFEVVEKTTSPPKRYTTSSLILVMKNIGKFITDPKLRAVMQESQGIGTEATRANIIKELVDAGYIRLDSKKQIFITDIGKYYVDNLKNDEITDPVFVAYWSYIMKQIRFGDDDYEREYNAFLDTLRAGIAKLKTMPKKERPKTPPLGNCPHCGAPVMSGKYGAYCTAKCGMNFNYAMGKKSLSDTEVKNLLSGKETKIKGAVKKNGETYTATVKLKGSAQSAKDPEKFFYDLEFVSHKK